MEGTPCKNICPAIRPLTINLPDSTKVKSTHTCDITIPGLPKVLVGHVVPKLTIASLIGIKVLCDTGCKVLFTKNKCNVWYKGNIILCGKKDPSTDLWTLPIYTDVEEGKQSINEPTIVHHRKRSAIQQRREPHCHRMHTKDLHTWQVSHTPSKQELTVSSLHISHCATQKSQHSLKLFEEVSLTDVQT
jgi:hypothetical protein